MIADRVIQLLQSSAQLEFWEVYNNDEVYKYFEDARSIISDKLKAQQEKDTTKVETVVSG